MDANMLNRITPWPWCVRLKKIAKSAPPNDCSICTAADGKNVCSTAYNNRPDQERRDNAKFLALAPDHALLLAAFVAGKLECLFSSNENGTTIGGCSVGPSRGGEGGPAPQIFRFEMDPFGCPIVNDELRAALRVALGLEKGGGR